MQKPGQARGQGCGCAVGNMERVVLRKPADTLPLFTRQQRNKAGTRGSQETASVKRERQKQILSTVSAIPPGGLLAFDWIQTLEGGLPKGFCVAPSKNNAGSLLSRIKLQVCAIPLLQGTHSADHHLGTGRNGPWQPRVAQLGETTGGKFQNKAI